MMQESDKLLRDQVRQVWPSDAGQGPSFDDAWAAAGQHHESGRRRYRQVAGFAAIAAALIVALLAESPTQETYIEVAELLESTYWQAPSDVLLPDRQFDIYQDMPVLFESTEPAGGTLL